MSSLAQYVEEAIRRISAGDVQGSHAAGVYNKAANQFEKEFAAYVSVVARIPNAGNLTLGQLIHRLETMPNPHPSQLAAVVANAKAVNDPWKRLKHRDDPPMEELLGGLRAIVRALPLPQKAGTT